MTTRLEFERALIGLLGLLLFAFGVTGLVFGDAEFGGDPIDGTATGATWLGAEGNAWTFLACMFSGVALFGASSARPAAKTAAVVFAVLLGSLAVIALLDGDDVLGVLAANRTTAAIWGVAALLLLMAGLAPGAPRDAEDWTPMDETRPEDAIRFDRAQVRDRTR